MADETSNRIGFDIVVDTKASDNNITTIKQDISNLQKAIEQANKTGLSINIDGVKRSLEEAQKLQGEFISKLDKLNASRLDNVNKVANREIEIFRKASEEKLKIAQRDAEQQAKAQQSRGTNYFSQAKSGLQSEWMNNYYDYSKGNIGAREYAQNVSKIKIGAQELTKEINKMGVAFDQSTERGISFSNKLKSHLYWITAGTLLGAVTALPYEVFTTLEKLDTGMAGMNQVIDHTAIATTAAKTGISEQTVAQTALNTEQDKFISIASTYGESVDKVIESGQRWARTYKDLDTVNALVSQSTKLAVADNFSMAEANKYVEAAMFQYGLTAKNTSEAMAYSGNVIDVWTKLAHNAGASAQDIAKGVEQAGSAAHIAGADFEFLSAQIATGVRATGKSGNEIGTMLKSLYTSFHSDKAVAELDKLGVSIYKIGNDGQKEFRKAQDVMLDLAVSAQETDKSLESVYKNMAGGRHICPLLL